MPTEIAEPINLSGQGISTIDLQFLGVDGVIAAYLIDCGGQLTLVETGPSTTLGSLTTGIERGASTCSGRPARPSV